MEPPGRPQSLREPPTIGMPPRGVGLVRMEGPFRHQDADLAQNLVRRGLSLAL